MAAGTPGAAASPPTPGVEGSQQAQPSAWADELPPLFDSLAVGVVMHSFDGVVIASNAAARRMLEGLPVSVLSNAVGHLDQDSEPRSFTVSTPHSDGSPRRLLATAMPWINPLDATHSTVVTTLREVSRDVVRAPMPRRSQEDAPEAHETNDKQTKRTDDEAHPDIRTPAFDLAERRWRATTEASPIGTALIGLDARVIEANRAFARMSGREDTAGLELAEIIHPHDVAAHSDHLARLRQGEASSYEVELRLARPDGAYTWTRWSGAPVSDDEGRISQVAVQVQDRSEARAALARLTHQALHDPLSGLPNRTLCAERVERLVHRSRRRGGTVAVLVCDLDDFRVVNDSVGPAGGDRVLSEVAARLRRALRADVVVARLAGDEFVVATEVSDRDDAIALARYLIGVVGDPVELHARVVIPSVSIGVSLSEHASRDGAGHAEAWMLIRDASSALHQAKRNGRGALVVADEDLRTSSRERLDLEQQLRRGVRADELRLHLQDIVDLRDGSVVGREALVRWQHPQHGLLGPARFLPIAEDSGLIQDLGRWVIEAAARIAADSPGSGYLAINVSPSQVRHPGLTQQIEQALSRAGVEPDRLVVELTESVMLDAAQQARDQLTRLDDMGVRIVVDDFGTGFSALSHLRDLPVSGIKIDRSFTQGLGHDRHCDRIVEALTGLAAGLGVDLVAEGVETEQQAQLLTGIGCQHAQGYLFGRPQPV